MEPLLAYLHYLAIILIAGFLVAEMVVCRPSLEAEQVRLLPRLESSSSPRRCSRW